MEHAPIVAERDAGHELEEERLDNLLTEWFGLRVKIFFEVEIEILKDESQFLLGVYHVVKSAAASLPPCP